MKLFRNPELKKCLVWCAVISAVGSVSAFVWDWRFGIFTAVLCTLIMALFFYTTSRRYRKIASLTESLDKILHGNEQLSLAEYAEGELGLLQSEIYKMTVRLREQSRNLQDDKLFLSDSIADISHQIRTPLTSINLLVQFLSEPNLSEERRLALTRELLGLLSRIDWLITTLLKISRLDAGTVRFQKEAVRLKDLIQKSVSTLLVPIELREQNLKINADGNFEGDLSWTSEAVGNIVKNCMEHTPTGGTITIDATETALYAEIVISDTGSGIDQEDLPHLFERFYKGKNSEGNSFGVGLALSRMIIAAQNGTVKAENIPSGGARFTIRFYRGTV